jgi:hypothetical protein
MNLVMSPTLFSRLVDALIYDQSAPMLAFVLSTAYFSRAALISNCVQNIQYLLNHPPMANQLVGATPSEALELACPIEFPHRSTRQGLDF